MLTIKGVLISKERHSWDSSADFYHFKRKKKKKDFLKARRPNFALWWDNSLDQIQSLNLLLKLQQCQSKLLPRLDFHPVKCTCPSEICSWLKWKAEHYTSCQCNLIPIHNFKQCTCRTAPKPTKINGNFSSDTSPCWVWSPSLKQSLLGQIPLTA